MRRRRCSRLDSRNRKIDQRVVVANQRSRGVALVTARLLVFLGVAVLLSVGTAGFVLYAKYARGLPPIIPFEEHTYEGVTTFHADDGQVIGELYEERRILLPYEKIPRRLVLAFLAVEDKRFFSHEGIDLRGVLRAALSNLRAGGVVEGGSTITQQLAKQTLGRDKTLARKVREAIFARRLEDRYTKEQILLLYLNKIYLGHNSYGIQAAAQNYFRKNVWELSLGEMAMIAGLPQSPSRVNPAVNMAASRKRQKEVLERMVDAGFATREEADVALATPLVVYPLMDDFATKVPWFTEEVRRSLGKLAGDDWLRRGLSVFTTASVPLGLAAEEALADGLYAVDRQQGYRGPLAKVPDAETRDGVLARVEAWFRGAPALGDITPVIVASLSKTGLEVLVTPSVRGFLPLSELRWAGPYTELPLVDRTVRRGGVAETIQVRDESKAVSYKPKPGDVAATFHPGDVLLARVIGEPTRKPKGWVATPEGQLRLTLMQPPKVEGAFVAFDQDTGQVKALVGGWDHDRSEVDRVHALRQTGSTMKPLVYSLAYDMGLPPSTVLSGAPFRLDGYNPTGDKAVPDMTLWDGLTKSENSISLRTLQYVLDHGSKERWREWGQRLGLGRELRGYPSEVLGTDQTLWDMTGAFSVFAREGRVVPRTLIRKIVDRDGRVVARRLVPGDGANDARDMLDALYDAAAHPPRQVIDPATAYVTAANLHEVTVRGTGSRVGKELDHEAAGKTGTLPYDVWFIGFTDHFVAGAWIGSDRRERPLGRSVKQNRIHGGDAALPVWLDWMKLADAGRPKRKFTERTPAGVELARIDPVTGMLAREGGMLVPHKKGTAPVRSTPIGATPGFVESYERDF